MMTAFIPLFVIAVIAVLIWANLRPPKVHHFGRRRAARATLIGTLGAW